MPRKSRFRELLCCVKPKLEDTKELTRKPKERHRDLFSILSSNSETLLEDCDSIEINGRMEQSDECNSFLRKRRSMYSGSSSSSNEDDDLNLNVVYQMKLDDKYDEKPLPIASQRPPGITSDEDTSSEAIMPKIPQIAGESCDAGGSGEIIVHFSAKYSDVKNQPGHIHENNMPIDLSEATPLRKADQCGIVRKSARNVNISLDAEASAAEIPTMSQGPVGHDDEDWFIPVRTAESCLSFPDVPIHAIPARRSASSL